MPRHATERPLTEHVATLARLTNQISVNERLPKKKRTTILSHLGEVMRLLQIELGK